MPMADVVQDNLVPFDAIDFDNYSEGGGGKSYAPPAEGRYFGKVPMITDEMLVRTKAGYRSVKIDPIEVLATGDGTALPEPYNVRFTSLSAKKYSNREGSQIMDFLRACGIDARPRTEAELDAAIKTASGRTFQFQLIWEAYNKDSQENTQGYENFPVDPQNPEKRLPYIVDQYDTTKRWWANGKIKYFVSAVAKQQ